MSYAKPRKRKYNSASRVENRERNIARALRREEGARNKWAYRRRYGKAVERGTARAKRRTA